MKKALSIIGMALAMAACASPPSLPPAPVAAPKAKTWHDLTAADLTATYGTPSFARKENGSEIWRYDVGACRIFFFLYQGGQGLQVRHLESIPAGNGQPIEQNCLNAFRLRLKKG